MSGRRGAGNRGRVELLLDEHAMAQADGGPLAIEQADVDGRAGFGDGEADGVGAGVDRRDAAARVGREDHRAVQHPLDPQVGHERLFAERVLAFYDGRIIADAPPAVALEDPEVKRFVVGGELHRLDEAQTRHRA